MKNLLNKLKDDEEKTSDMNHEIRKRNEKITEDKKDPTQRIIPNYYTLHGKI